MEFLYSDAGQLLWMQGYCHPIRGTDWRARNIDPADLSATVPDVSGAVFPSNDQLAGVHTDHQAVRTVSLALNIKSSPISCQADPSGRGPITIR